MPSRSRASSSATHPCSRSPAPASRPPAACPTSARPAASGSGLDPMVDGHVDMLSRDPARVWQCWAEPLVGAQIAHNPAHAALARLEAGGFVSGVVTQNIDGLHHAAGSVAIEVHGHLRTRAACAAAPRRRWRPRSRATPRPGGRPSASSAAARCGRRSCSSASRSRLGLGARGGARRALGGCLCVGTSLQVYPAAGIAEAFARRRRPLAIVSREATALWEDADPRLLRSAEELLPAVASILLTNHPIHRFTLKLRQEALRAGQDPSQPFQCRRAM